MIYDKASLVQIPSGYKSGTLYSVVPNTADGDFTVTGDPEGEATRVNKDGLIETVAADVPRLNYNFIDGVVQPDPHLLLEPTRTNQILYSEDFTNAVWQKISGGTGVAPVVTANYSVAPDGSNTADRVVLDMGSNTSINDYSIIRNFGTSGSTGTNSVYIKSNTSDSYTLGIDNTGQQETITVTPQWQRFSYSVTNSDRLQISLRGGGQTVSAYADVSIWGGSLENGNYVTSYIPTTTGAVTRTADTCGDAGNGTIIKAEGGLFVDFTTSNTDNFKRIYIISNSDFNNSIFIQLSETSFAIQIVSGGTTLYSWGFVVTLSDRHKIALRYKDGDSKLYYNGVQKTATTASGTWFSEGLLNKFTFSPSSFFNFYGEVNQAMIFNEALSDSELETITSYTSFNQMAKALLYTIE